MKSCWVILFGFVYETKNTNLKKRRCDTLVFLVFTSRPQAFRCSNFSTIFSYNKHMLLCFLFHPKNLSSSSKTRIESGYPPTTKV